MPSTVEQAWALPVNIVTLGAHLSVYTASRTAINTLRLCHRFGPQDRGITKLPLELLDHVERYLHEPGRKKEFEAWHQDRRGCEGLWTLLDDDEIRSLFEAFQEDGEFTCPDEIRQCCSPEDSAQDCGLCGYLGSREPGSKELIAHQRVKVVEYVARSYEHRRYLGNDYYRVGCDPCSKDFWMARISRGSRYWGRNGRGLEIIPGLQGDEMSSTLREDFGLDLRIVHGPWESPLLEDDRITRPTTAYLQLPSEGDAPGQGQAQSPTPAQTALFQRAVRILGLEVLPGSRVVKVSAKSGDLVNVSGGDVEKSTEPRLTTFSRFADNVNGKFSVWETDFYATADPKVPMHYREWKWAVVKAQEMKRCERRSLIE